MIRDLDGLTGSGIPTMLTPIHTQNPAFSSGLALMMRFHRDIHL